MSLKTRLARLGVTHLLASLLVVGLGLALFNTIDSPPAHAYGSGGDYSGWLNNNTTPEVQAGLDNYDNYNFENIYGAWPKPPGTYPATEPNTPNPAGDGLLNNTGDARCYLGASGGYGGPNPAPPGQAQESIEENWLSPAGLPNTDNYTISSGSIGPISLQLNILSMACQEMSAGYYFPNDIPSAFNWNWGANYNYPVGELTYVQDLNPPVVGGVPQGTITGVSSTPIAQSDDLNTKYWLAGPMGFTYNPPPTLTAGVITITGHVAQLYHSRNSTSGVDAYQCVGDPTDVWYNLNYLQALNDLKTVCTSYSTALSLPINIKSPNASCGTITVPSAVQAGSSFNIQATMNNPSGSSSTDWSTANGDDLTGSFNGGAPYSIALPYSDPISGANDSIDVPPGSSATFNDTQTAPTTAGTYSGTYQMEQSGTAFGAACPYTVTVVRLYKYVPTISISPSSGTSVLPADNAPVTPGEVLNLTETVYNTNTTATSAGDPFNWDIKSYTGPYAYGNSDITFSPATGGDDRGGGYDPNGVPAGGNNVEPVDTFTVPAGATDGTQYCFYAGVTPAERDTPMTGYTYQYAYSDYADASHTTADYTNTSDANIRSAFSGGVATTSNDMCVEVENVRNLNLQVTQGDVHAGGGVGGSCTLAGGNGQIKGDTGSYAQYVASSYSTSTNFPTGGNGNTYGLSLGNQSGQGNYGVVCRPDMVKAAQSYITKYGIQSTITGLTYLNNLGSGIYVATGPLYLAQTAPITHQVTIYCDRAYNCTNVRIFTNITYSTSTSINSLPSFGLIDNGGEITIDNNVTQLDGFYVAQGTYTGLNSPLNTGVINTCTTHTTGNTGDCPNQLNVLGSLMANSFVFGRTGVATNLAGNVVTESITQSGLLYLAPPPAFGTQPTSTAALPIYGGEGLPLY